MKIFSYKKNSYWKYHNCFVTDSFEQFSLAAKSLDPDSHKLLLVAEKQYASFYMKEITDLFKGLSASFEICELENEKEEPDKCLSKIGDAATSMQLEKDDLVISFGGSFCDLIVRTFLGKFRPELKYIQIPLTLTAQLLASAGSLHVIEIDRARILAAAEIESGDEFASLRPALVYINLMTYQFLSKDERLSGMGEVLRAAVSADKNFFHYIESNIGKKTDNFTEYLLNLMMNCLEINEKSDPAHLYGYTIAKGLEGCTNYIIPHGSAVGIGMVVAGSISSRRGLLNDEDHFRIAKIMVSYGLSVSMNFTNELIEAIVDSIRKEPGLVDENGNFSRFTLLNALGDTSFVSDVSMDEVLDVMNYRRF